MRQAKFVFRPLSDGAALAFADAGAAWLWFFKCQQARLDGARFSAGLAAPRPCDPDDIGRVVMTLLRDRKIGKRHLSVLGAYGRQDRPPHLQDGASPAHARLWDEAMGAMAPILRRKGIVS